MLKKYDFTMKPVVMRGWCVLRETKKCYVVRKEIKKYGGKYDFVTAQNRLPKKYIDKMIESKSKVLPEIKIEKLKHELKGLMKNKTELKDKIRDNEYEMKGIRKMIFEESHNLYENLEQNNRGEK